MKTLQAVAYFIAAIIVLAGLGWALVAWLFGPNDGNNLQPW